MPLPDIEDTYRCAIQWEAPTGGAPAVNVLHVRQTVPADADAVIAALNDNAADHMFDFVDSEAQVIEIVVTPLFNNLASVTGNLPNWNGAAVGEAIPQFAAVIQEKTAARGPSFRGRVFLPYLTENLLDNGRLDSATRVDVEAAWNTFRGLLEADDHELVVASYLLAEANTVTDVAVSSAPGRIRRRLG